MLATLALIVTAVMFARIRKKAGAVAALQTSIRRVETENFALNVSLENSKRILDEALEEVNARGTFLEQWHIKHALITFEDKSLGEGSFGTVLLGSYRGNKIAVKTVRTTKCDAASLKEFLKEIEQVCDRLPHRTRARRVLIPSSVLTTAAAARSSHART